MIYISDLLSDAEMRELVEETEAGVESIDFSIAEKLDRLSESVRFYKERLRKIGTEDVTFHGPFLDLNPVTFDSEIRKVTMRRFQQAYSAALELGAKKIVFHTGFHPDIYYLIGWADRMADFFHEFLNGRDEIQIVLENLYDREYQALIDVKKQLSESNFGLCLDLGHANCFSPVPVTTWAKEMAPYVKHVHVHDNMGDRDAHLALGNGNIPVEQVLQELKGSKECTYTIECNCKEDVRTSFYRLKMNGI